MKKILILLLIFTNISLSNAQNLVTTSFLSGTYDGVINGDIETSLFLEQQENEVQGTLVTNDYHYQFVGKIVKNDSINAEGTLSDMQQGTTIPCNISLIGNVLFVHLLNTNDQFTSNKNVILFHLDKKTGATFDQKKFQYLLDPKLVGRWIKQDVLLNGAFSIQVETSMKFNRDGTFETSNYTLIEKSENEPIASDPKEKVKKETLYGKWVASNNILYVIPHNAEYITPITKYQVISDYKLKTNAYDPTGTEEIWEKKAK